MKTSKTFFLIEFCSISLVLFASITYFFYFSYSLLDKSSNFQKEMEWNKQTEEPNRLLISCISELQAERDLSVSYLKNEQVNPNEMFDQRMWTDIALKELQSEKYKGHRNKKKRFFRFQNEIKSIHQYRMKIDKKRMDSGEVNFQFSKIIDSKIKELGNINKLSVSEISNLQFSYLSVK